MTFIGRLSDVRCCGGAVLYYCTQEEALTASREPKPGCDWGRSKRSEPSKTWVELPAVVSSGIKSETIAAASMAGQDLSGKTWVCYVPVNAVIVQVAISRNPHLRMEAVLRLFKRFPGRVTPQVYP